LANDTQSTPAGQRETQEKDDSTRASVAVADVEVELPDQGHGEPGDREPVTQEDPPEAAPESTVSLSQHIQLQAEKEALFQRMLRLQAEFDNFRKRTDRERKDFFDYALADFVRKLLPVLDGFERGLFAPEGETVENFKTGFQLILKQFKDVLIQAGLQPIPTSGQFFDPNYHQALMREETETFADNQIISEMQRGYTFKGRLLRPSLVRVAATPEKMPTLSGAAEDPSEQSAVGESSTSAASDEKPQGAVEDKAG
jgi:molecular chaperone GrpE